MEIHHWKTTTHFQCDICKKQVFNRYTVTGAELLLHPEKSFVCRQCAVAALVGNAEPEQIAAVVSAIRRSPALAGALLAGAL